MTSVQPKSAFFLVAGLILSFQAFALDRLEIAYFVEWPMPILLERIEKNLQNTEGIEINWRAVETGSDMNRLMQSGDIHIALGQEFLPFIRGISQGLDIVATGVSVSYPEFDLCVVENNARIDPDSPESFENKKIATILDSYTHYRLLKALDYLKINPESVELVGVGDGSRVAKLLLKKNRNVDIGCAYGGPAVRMLESGTPLLNGDELESIGLKYFDLIVMPRWFLKQHADLAQYFMDIALDLNRKYRADPEKHYRVLAEESGLDLKTTKFLLNGFYFPDADMQASSEWLGEDGVVENLGEDFSRFLVNRGMLEQEVTNLGKYIDTSLLQ